MMELKVHLEAIRAVAVEALRQAFLRPDRALGKLLRPAPAALPEASTPLPDAVAASLALAVERADRFLPGRSSCVRRAAALTTILRRRGVSTAVLRIGVAGGQEGVEAHAWVETEEGRPFGLRGDHGRPWRPLDR